MFWTFRLPAPLREGSARRSNGRHRHIGPPCRRRALQRRDGALTMSPEAIRSETLAAVYDAAQIPDQVIRFSKLPWEEGSAAVTTMRMQSLGALGRAAESRTFCAPRFQNVT